MASRRILGIGQLGRRLVLAFVAVAVAAILINAVISEVSFVGDIAVVADQQQDSLGRAVALTSGAAYQGIGWRHADLRPVFDVARRAGAAVQVRDRAGRVVGSTPGFRRFPVQREARRPVFSRGQLVGVVTVRFGPSGLGALARTIAAERWRSRIEAVVIAVLLALAVSVVAARRITRPLDLMLDAARRRGAGDRSARVDPLTGAGEVRELLRAFNWSTDAVDEQDRLRRNLVADVAHGLRTPVAVLQAGHEAMLDGVTKPTTANLASLRDEVLRLARMVDDLQALASAEAAALQLELAPENLAAIAADAASSLADSYERKGVSLVPRLASSTIDCDRSRIYEIVVNLLTNALKFTPRGGTVELRTTPDRGAIVLLRVSDTGIGIPAEDLPRVTERFYRGARSRDSTAGSGIGLTIVSELVRAHHGDLEIASESGTGTRVTVRFPAAGARPAGGGLARDRRHAG